MTSSCLFAKCDWDRSPSKIRPRQIILNWMKDHSWGCCQTWLKIDNTCRRKSSDKHFKNKCMVLYHSIWIGVIPTHMFHSSCHRFSFDMRHLSLFLRNCFLWVVIISSTTWRYRFWIGIVYLPWPCISTSALSSYFHTYHFPLTGCYKFRIFMQTSKYPLNHILYKVVEKNCCCWQTYNCYPRVMIFTSKKTKTCRRIIICWYTFCSLWYVCLQASCYFHIRIFASKKVKTAKDVLNRKSLLLAHLQLLPPHYDFHE